MPKISKISRNKVLKDDANFVFEAEPEKVDVEKESKRMSTDIGFDPKKLTDILLKIGIKMYGVDLYSYQVEPARRIIYSLLANDGAEITILVSRQSGKSEILSYIVVVMNRCITRLWSESVMEFLNDPDISDMPLSKVHFKLKSGTSLLAQSGNKNSKIESKTYSLVIVDEAQDVDAEKIRKCLAFDTKITMPNGVVKPLYKVIKKKLAIAGTDSNIIKPYKFYDNGLQQLYRISINNSSYIDATLAHKHKIIRRGKNNNKPFIITTAELQIGDRLPVPSIMPFFGDLYSYEEGLVTGMMLGDGCSPVKNSPMFCGFKGTVDKFTEITEKLWGSNIITYNINDDNGLHEVRVTGNTINNEGTRNNKWGSNKFKEYLKEVGIYGLKAKHKKVPNKAFSKEFYRGLIEGLIETDGSIGIDKTKIIISYSSVSKRLVNDLKRILLKFGVHSSIFSRDNNRGFSKRNALKLHILQIKDVDSIRIFYKEFKLITKQSKLANNISIIDKIKSRNKSKLYPSNERYYAIKSIVEIKKASTYCIDTGTDDHLWVANGIITHNSIIPMTAATFGTIVYSGTPNRVKGYFYNKIRQNARLDRKLRNRNKEYLRNHFEYDYKKVSEAKKEQFEKDGKRFHTLYEKAIKRDFLSMGAKSDEVRMSYKLNWLVEEGMFLTEEKMEKYMYRKIGFPKATSEDFIVAGLDVAKSRASTVLTLGVLDKAAEEYGDRPIKTVLGWTVLDGTNYEEQVEIISHFLITNNVRILYGDATGVGAALIDLLNYFIGERVDVYSYIFSTPSKSEMWKTLEEDIYENRIIVPAKPAIRDTKEFKEFEEEALFLTKSYKGAYMVCQKTSGYKDDMMDSLALMNLAGNTIYSSKSVVEVSQSPFFMQKLKNKIESSW